VRNVGFKTSDFIVDTLEQWWKTLTHQEQTDCQLIQIKVDNGPESSGVRTQFLNRMVKWADAIQKPIQLLPGVNFSLMRREFLVRETFTRTPK
jgi:Rhodopirellula transposase DDE domain